MASPSPAEDVRLDDLRAHDILDTEPEPAFDRLTRLTARVFDVPIALVSLVDQNRQWFKSCHGLDMKESPRDIAFCAHAILQDDVMVVTDTAQDPRFADSPFVTEMGIRFYAGAPLLSYAGNKLGTLCIKDRVPRGLSPDERETLADLAAVTVDEMELRLALSRVVDVGQEQFRARSGLERSSRRLEQLGERVSEETAPVLDAIIREARELDGRLPDAKPALERIIGSAERAREAVRRLREGV